MSATLTRKSDPLSDATGGANSVHLAQTQFTAPSESWLGVIPALEQTVQMGGPLDAPENLALGNTVKGLGNQPRIGVKRRGM